MRESLAGLDSLKSIEIFVRTAEDLSFVATARTTGLSPSAVGKSIARLERSLGVTLLRRSTRSMSLTAEGEALLLHGKRIIGELEAAREALGGETSAPSGRLKVGMPVVGRFLDGAVERFVRTYPLVRLDVDFSDRLVDPIGEGYDVLLRIGEVADSRLISRRLTSFRLRLVAAPAYLAERGIPESAEDLFAHHRLVYRFPTSGRIEAWPVPGWEEIARNSTSQATVTNSIEALFHLCERGRGLACLPELVLAEALERGSLVSVLSHHVSAPRSITLLWPNGRSLPARARAFVDLLEDEFARDR